MRTDIGELTSGWAQFAPDGRRARSSGVEA